MLLPGHWKPSSFCSEQLLSDIRFSRCQYKTACCSVMHVKGELWKGRSMAPLEKRGCNGRSTMTLLDIKDMNEKTNRISRRVYRWSKAARDLVRANINVSGSELSRLVTHLVEESMNPRWACLKFARRM